MIVRSVAAGAILALSAVAPAHAQALHADPEYRFANPAPAYERGKGPVVGIDGGHHNYNTVEGRYAPFARLVADDGFRVRALTGPFDAAALSAVDVLVVVNAQDASNVDNWRLPTPAAFTAGEIEAVKGWVAGGGALLLVADHMPFAGASAPLAKAFGFGFVNGYVFAEPGGETRLTFAKDHGLILDDLGVGLPPTHKVVTFTGQAFTVPDDAVPLLYLSGRFVAALPAVAGRFDGAPRIDVSGYMQAAIMPFGKGRVAVFGEAAALSAQKADDGSRVGMNADGAEDNAAFALKVVRWLAGYHPR